MVFEIYIMSWLRSFNVEGGPLPDGNDVYTLYQYQGIAGCAAAFLMLGFVGKLADTLPPKVFLPIMLLIRAIFFFMAFKIKDPSNLPFYFIVPMLHVSYFGVVMTFKAYLTKMYPSDLRGMMNSC